jgi:LuxR family maltose regulon positive regulatory protein
MTRLPHDATAPPPPVLPVLSPRQLQVVQLLARQMSSTQISTTMSISVNTVRTRVRQALRKLGTDHREEAVQTARERGLV